MVELPKARGDLGVLGESPLFDPETKTRISDTVQDKAVLIKVSGRCRPRTCDGPHATNPR